MYYEDMYNVDDLLEEIQDQQNKIETLQDKVDILLQTLKEHVSYDTYTYLRMRYRLD